MAEDHAAVASGDPRRPRLGFTGRPVEWTGNSKAQGKKPAMKASLRLTHLRRGRRIKRLVPGEDAQAVPIEKPAPC